MTIHNWPYAIAHVDADCFYASCELVRRPVLRGRPLCVLSSQNACVVAKTYDAKARGITTGMPVWEARRKLPEAIYLSADFAYYGQMSQKMFSILERFTPEVEQYSIDEGFLGMQGLRTLWGKSYAGIADDIRQTVKRELGITVSVGVSVSRTLAKMASEKNKPDGVIVVPCRQIGPFLKAQHVCAIPGIGKSRAALLEKFSLGNAAAFAAAEPGLVHRLLGRSGVNLWHELNGTSIWPLELVPRLPKSVAKTASLGVVSSEKRLIATHLTHHIARLATELVARRLLARRLIVFVRLKSFACERREIRLDYPCNNFFRFNAEVRQALADMYRAGEMYRGCGVVARAISHADAGSEDMFGIMREDARQARLMLTVAGINHRYGRGTVAPFICSNRKPERMQFFYPLLSAK